MSSTATTPSATQTESELVGMILDRAASRGWLGYHARPARVKDGWRTPGQGNGARGFPDLILARAGVVIVWEVKTARGRLTTEQTQWLDAAGGVCVRPADWPRVCEILDGPEEVPR